MQQKNVFMSRHLLVGLFTSYWGGKGWPQEGMARLQINHTCDCQPDEMDY